MSIFRDGLYIRLINEFEIANGSSEYYLLGAALIIFAVVASYLLGSLSSAIIVSKTLYKEDIRKYGSGNAGLTNILRTYGKGAALLTLIGDMLKAAVSILIAASLFGFSYNNCISLSGVCYLAGTAAVLGHVFPIFYGFKGGKGVLVTATMALVLTPVIFLALILVFILVVTVSGFVSLGSIIVAALFPVTVCLYAYFLGGSVPILTAVCSIFLGAFVIWCHRSNIDRLRKGTEKKISIGKKKG